MHPSVHLELARIRQQELITKARRSRAALARLDLGRVEEPRSAPRNSRAGSPLSVMRIAASQAALNNPTLRRRSSTVPLDARM